MSLKDSLQALQARRQAAADVANLRARIPADLSAEVDALDVRVTVLEGAPGGGPVAAEDVSVTPAGNLASTDAQAALEELQADIDTRATSAAVTTLDGRVTTLEGQAIAEKFNPASRLLQSYKISGMSNSTFTDNTPSATWNGGNTSAPAITGAGGTSGGFYTDADGRSRLFQQRRTGATVGAQAGMINNNATSRVVTPASRPVVVQHFRTPSLLLGTERYWIGVVGNFVPSTIKGAGEFSGSGFEYIVFQSWDGANWDLIHRPDGTAWADVPIDPTGIAVAPDTSYKVTLDYWTPGFITASITDGTNSWSMTFASTLYTQTQKTVALAVAGAAAIHDIFIGDGVQIWTDL